ncbi:hypothetical protein BH11ACT4_BH11ACT4_09540 [soil metagenome]
MLNFVIRPPRGDEAQLLADLHILAWQQTYAEVFPASAWGEEARAGRVRQWTVICTRPIPDWHTAVAESDGSVVGIAHTESDRDDPPLRGRKLAFIYLLTEAHGSGAGQALLDEVLGDDPASLWVLEQNARARAFYVRNGFVADGARQPTGYGGDEIRMVR